MSNRYFSKDHPITNAAPIDPKIDKDPSTINRVHKVAPCPEVTHAQHDAGEHFLSGGGSRGIKGHTGSGKGSLDHVPRRFLGEKPGGGRHSLAEPKPEGNK